MPNILVTSHFLRFYTMTLSVVLFPFVILFDVEVASRVSLEVV